MEQVGHRTFVVCLPETAGRPWLEEANEAYNRSGLMKWKRELK